jgi:Uma2 family endonuclease
MRSTHLNYDDYLQLPDDGKRHEIIDGDHYVTPAPRTKHQSASNNTATAITVFGKQHKLGSVFTAPCDVILSDEDIVQPDIVFICVARANIITEENIQGAPDLVIEILSESTCKRDEVIQRKLYERFGVQEYWIIDPELETVKIFTRSQQGFGRPVELSKEAGDTLTTELLVGFKLPLTEIFE